MSYKLVIAEKPSVEQSIAKVIGVGKRENRYLEVKKHYGNKEQRNEKSSGNVYLYV